MHQRGLGFEQARHGQTLAMHSPYELLERRTRVDTVRTHHRQFDRLLAGIYAVCHRWKCARRFFSGVSLDGVRRQAQVQMLRRCLNRAWHPRLQPILRWRGKGDGGQDGGQQEQRADFKCRVE